MKVYTKKGDEGYTTRYDGSKVRKDDPIIVLVSKIDSLLGSLDTAIVSLKDEELVKILEEIQGKLWQTAGEISLGGKGKKVENIIESKDIEKIELWIDKYHPDNKFFVRFRSETSTRLNEARLKCRELEVMMTKPLFEGTIRREIYKYINRLSDLLYVLACKENEKE